MTDVFDGVLTGAVVVMAILQNKGMGGEVGHARRLELDYLQCVT